MQGWPTLPFVPSKSGASVAHGQNNVALTRNVAFAEEAHAHYGDPFTRRDACIYFLRDFAESLRRISGRGG
ncbi:hypothetical protein MUA04_03020 [Enterobacteriaceae bacterium H11S18]|uniref:hypothetical protein n=1 Tax=Dryocola clanedunensis TaxID=2925396 RepID=UPI0022F00C26|nr:hypothetical protein [Dryocola clanedunensis]MCT4709171.1 hypothetical protein [Dryocola clanedunensis]